MKMSKERGDKRICWIIGNIMFLSVFCITMLVPPSTGQAKKYNATIHDYVLDLEMYDNCTNKNFTRYCRTYGDCEAGTHVMCMYYKSGMIMGPQCEEGKMFRLNPEIINTILDEIKSMRDEISEGTVLGKGGVELPRAYNLRRRLVRNTFPNPEQFVGIDTFTRPEWTSTSRNGSLRVMENDCLTTSKVKDAIQAILRLLKEGGREQTTGDMIENYKGGPRNIYLNLLNHNTTHIGCGMSHYLGYQQQLDAPHPRHDVFVLQLVCNLSHRPIVGHMIYNTTEPEKPTTDPTTDPTTTSSSTTIKTNPSSTSKSGDIPGIRNLVPGGRGPGVLIMPIITMEDAPPALVQQRNLALRRSSGGVSQSNYNKFGNNNPQTEIAPYSRKNSIFARAPIFNLSPRNRDNTSNSNLEDKVLLKKQLKSLLDQVPRREIPRLRELLKQMVKKHTEENNTPRLGPVEIDTVATQELVPEQLNRVPPKLNHVPPNIVNAQSEFEIPIIRKQKPIVHAKGKDKPVNSDKDKTIVRGYSTAHKQGSNNLANNDLAIIDHIQAKPSQDQPNYGNDAEREQTIYAEGNKMNDHTQMASDNTKLKRRLHLENEISKLKRKLQNLRQYIRKNDVDENARIRPVVTSQSGQRNTKYDERKSFYMPDRAHPLHEY